MTRTILSYDKTRLGQDTGYFCGPATTQVILSGHGQIVEEATLARELGTDSDGTDYVGLIGNVLSRRLGVKYRAVDIPNDPPSPQQTGDFRAHLRRSLAAGYGVPMNWIVPPGNRPRAILGTQSPSYPASNIYHYVAALGYDADNDAVWVVDSGFWPREYWITLTQCVTLIAGKGYAYADAAPAPAGVEVPPKSDQSPVSSKDRHALATIAEGRRRNITPRGIKIALATQLVESNLVMYANPKVPESMAIPHEAVGSDGYSVGTFQQQVFRGPNGWWWGDAKTCMDPTLSAGLFFDRLAKLDYNNESRSPGSFAQDVQRSAYPSRYDERYADAEQLYNRLADIEDKGDSVLQTSRSIYRTSNNRTMTGDDASFGADATSHMNWVEQSAIRGELWALLLVKATANEGIGATKWWEVNAGNPNPGIDPWAVEKAKNVLNYIQAVNPAALENAIGKAS